MEYRILNHGIETHRLIFEEIERATTQIYLSSWSIDLSYRFDRSSDETLFDLLNRKAKDGVEVHLMMSRAFTTPVFENNCRLLSENTPHPRFQIKILRMVDDVWWTKFLRWTSILPMKYSDLNYCCSNLFHQRYLLVDDRIGVIGGLDIDDDIYCSLESFEQNTRGFCFLEHGVAFVPPTEFADFCRENFETEGRAVPRMPGVYGNFANENTEYAKTIELIESAEESILIQNQWLQSYPGTKNRIFYHLLQRLIDHPTVTVTIITNLNYPDVAPESDEGMIAWLMYEYYTYHFRNLNYRSLNYLRDGLTRLGWSDAEIDRRLRICLIDKQVLIHSKNLFIDHRRFLCTTSNIWDRSFTAGSDLELGLVVEGPQVTELENYLERELIETPKSVRWFAGRPYPGHPYPTTRRCTIFLILMITVWLIYRRSNDG